MPPRITISIVMFALTMPSGAIRASEPPVAQLRALRLCVDQLDATLKNARVSPEHYEIAMRHACPEEATAHLDATRAFFLAMPHPGVSRHDALEITEATMAKVQRSEADFRNGLISRYVVWRATQGDGSSPAAKR